MSSVTLVYLKYSSHESLATQLSSKSAPRAESIAIRMIGASMGYVGCRGATVSAHPVLAEHMDVFFGVMLEGMCIYSNIERIRV